MEGGGEEWGQTKRRGKEEEMERFLLHRYTARIPGSLNGAQRLLGTCARSGEGMAFNSRRRLNSRNPERKPSADVQEPILRGYPTGL